MIAHKKALKVLRIKGQQVDNHEASDSLFWSLIEQNKDPAERH